MITSEVPKTWKNLQTKVGEILEGCGFKIEIEKIVESVRGKVEIDVYAIEEIDGRKYSVLCECKYWKTNIPQTIIHAFRTVVNDTGCNIGYIITTSKFQSGAKESVTKSNVELLTWYEFQSLFFDSWFSNYFYRNLNKSLRVDNHYYSFEYFDFLTTEDKKLYFSIKNKIDEAFEVLEYFALPYMLKKEVANLPLFDNLYKEAEYYGEIPFDILNECDYENFIKKFVSHVEANIKELNNLYEKYKNST
ncbi:restriction endonuclease [Flavobacterium psychrophilum]|uniref:restriction endonuclease n=1 Tax=Flavobacterium psychrophilum TaxID=96345 RepID=UPI00106B2BC1|nr:restriction endonuclease [Flavobacterium psychrophilum]